MQLHIAEHLTRRRLLNIVLTTMARPTDLSDVHVILGVVGTVDREGGDTFVVAGKGTE